MEVKGFGTEEMRLPGTISDADMVRMAREERTDKTHGYLNTRYDGEYTDWQCLRNIDISLRRIADALEQANTAEQVAYAESLRKPGEFAEGEEDRV